MSIQSNINNAITIVSAGLGFVAKESGRVDYLKDKKAFEQAEKEYETLYQKGLKESLSDVELERMSNAANRAYESGQKAQGYKTDEQREEKLGELGLAKDYLKRSNEGDPAQVVYGDAEFVWDLRNDTYAGDRPWAKKGQEKLAKETRAHEMQYAIDKARTSRMFLQDAQASKSFKTKGASGLVQQNVTTPVMPGAGRRAIEVKPKEEKTNE